MIFLRHRLQIDRMRHYLNFFQYGVRSECHLLQCLRRRSGKDPSLSCFPHWSSPSSYGSAELSSHNMYSLRDHYVCDPWAYFVLRGLLVLLFSSCDLSTMSLHLLRMRRRQLSEQSVRRMIVLSLSSYTRSYSTIAFFLGLCVWSSVHIDDL